MDPWESEILRDALNHIDKIEMALDKPMSDAEFRAFVRETFEEPNG